MKCYNESFPTWRFGVLSLLQFCHDIIVCFEKKGAYILVLSSFLLTIDFHFSYQFLWPLPEFSGHFSVIFYFNCYETAHWRSASKNIFNPLIGSIAFSFTMQLTRVERFDFPASQTDWYFFFFKFTGFQFKNSNLRFLYWFSHIVKM